MPRKPPAKVGKDGEAGRRAARTVRLDGELDLRRADQVRIELLAAIDGADRVCVDMGGATRADVAFVQVLLAALRAAAQRGRPLEISGLEGGVVPPLLAALGLIPSEALAAPFLAGFAASEAAA
jgi:ABC-type transporter Mla MlaB component